MYVPFSEIFSLCCNRFISDFQQKWTLSSDYRFFKETKCLIILNQNKIKNNWNGFQRKKAEMTGNIIDAKIKRKQKKDMAYEIIAFKCRINDQNLIRQYQFEITTFARNFSTTSWKKWRKKQLLKLETKMLSWKLLLKLES